MMLIGLAVVVMVMMMVLVMVMMMVVAVIVVVVVVTMTITITMYFAATAFNRTIIWIASPMSRVCLQFYTSGYRIMGAMAAGDAFQET